MFLNGEFPTRHLRQERLLFGLAGAAVQGAQQQIGTAHARLPRAHAHVHAALARQGRGCVNAFVLAYKPQREVGQSGLGA